MSDLSNQLIAATVGGIVSAIATVVVGNFIIVEPIKDELKQAQHSLEIRNLTYGEVISETETNDFKFRLGKVERIDNEHLRITIFADNLSEKSREYFGIKLDKSTALTDYAEPLVAYRAKVYANSNENYGWIRTSIPPRTKHIPIVVDFRNVNKESKVLSTLNLWMTNDKYRRWGFNVTFNDVDISL